MKKIIFFSSILTMISCSSKDEQFCKCLKTGEELNSFSSKLFHKEITPALQKKMKNLRSAKDKACKNYQTMKGEKMMELKSQCK